MEKQKKGFWGDIPPWGRTLYVMVYMLIAFEIIRAVFDILTN